MRFVIPIVLTAVGAASAALVWLFWTRYEHDRDALVTEAGLEVGPILAARTLLFVNRADDQALEAAGISPRQRRLIMEHRPLTSLADLLNIGGVGPKTLRSAVDAASA